MENKNTHQEVERKLKNWTRNQGFLRAKHPVRRCGDCEKRSDYTKASWEVLSSPPGVSPSKGKQGTTRGKEKFPFTRANAQWVIHGFK